MDAMEPKPREQWTREDYEQQLQIVEDANRQLLQNAATAQIGYMAQRWNLMQDEFNRRLRVLEDKAHKAEVALEDARKVVRDLKRQIREVPA